MLAFQRGILVALVGFIVALTNTPGANAAAADPAAQKICKQMLTAIIDQDRDAFIAQGTDAVKAGTTDDVMKYLHAQIGARMADGYELTFLTMLKQAGYEVYLWKLSFKQGDDVVVRIAIKDGKVGGFFLQ